MNLLEKMEFYLNRNKCVYGGPELTLSGKTEVDGKTYEEAKAEAIRNMNIVVLLDNGHASTTVGKRSPDGKFREYKFARDVTKKIGEYLSAIGIRYHMIVPEVDEDVALSKRASRANAYCDTYGKDRCLFISVHVNAYGDGNSWTSPRGWSVWTTRGKTRSDEYADIFWEEAKNILPQYGMTMRQDLSDGDKDYEENFTVIYKTKCPAVLTENLFMTNKKDYEFLMTDECINAIAQAHVNAIVRIAKTILLKK